jgi:hypothetical protein
MASSSTGVARGSSYRPYARTNSGSSSSLENLPPRTLSRVAKEVRDLVKNPPEGIRLVVDGETGLPSSLGEIVVRGFQLVELNASIWASCHGEKRLGTKVGSERFLSWSILRWHIALPTAGAAPRSDFLFTFISMNSCRK